jgi:hypothetical protein
LARSLIPKLVFALAWLVLAVCAAVPARAQASAAATTTRTFALVVSNNRSLSLALPDLQYADDDAARYYRLFRASGADPMVELLTTFDRNSERLYPHLTQFAKPATRPGLVRAVAALRKGVQAARARGERTVLYFVFAGHGEVAGGRGYLHLEETRIDGAFIEREIIEKIPADTKHVLLDSCNSFFVINPRKPGGRRWATPEDMALGFSTRHPEVGLFLSTNSDEEVFEWSEIESGVFSHEVRSGLTGAADVNQDGAITYSELGGFIARANAAITSETLRPQVYFSGPYGNEQAALFSTRQLIGRRLVLGVEQGRAWVRGQTGERLVDLHKERGALQLTLPDAAGQELSVSVRAAGENAGPPRSAEYLVAPGDEPIRLSELSAAPPLLAARGHRLFGSIFALPYGAAAYAEFVRARRQEPAPVYGVRDDDIRRVRHYLTAMADVDDYQRSAGAAGLISAGALFAGVSIAGQFDQPRWATGASIGLGAAGALLAGSGLYLAFSDSNGELALRAFDADLAARRSNQALVFARTEQKLAELARAENTRRQVLFWSMQGLGLAAAVLGTGTLLNDSERSVSLPATLYGSGAMMSALGFYLLTQETPTERMLRLYRGDPGLKLSAGVTPVPAGAMFGLSGSF